jgi:predicted glycosyltransferase
MRVLIHVQNLLGSGHLRRIVLVARALVQRGAAVTILYGGLPLPDLDRGGATLVQLPPAQAFAGDLATLRDPDGAPLGASDRERRCALVLRHLTDLRPEILVIETYPFGRRALRFELEPLVAAARALEPRPRIVASIRDILVAPSADRQAETIAILRRDFDRVLVHGDPRFLPLESSFPIGPIADLLAYTGFVAPDPPVAEGPAGVLVSAGGGAVGDTLLAAARAARPLCRVHGAAPWRLLAGRGLPADRWAALASGLPAGIELDRERPDFRAKLVQARVSVSQAGYNTSVDLLSAKVPAVLVPYEAPGETEQRLRADRFAELGLARVLAQADLTPARLAAAIDAAEVPRAHGFDLNGAARSAGAIEALARGIDPPR